MNVLSIPILNDDGSLQFHAELTKNEVISLLQLAINVSASVGLGAWKKDRDERNRLNEELMEDEKQPLND